MSWDLQDLGAHMRERHGYWGEWAGFLPPGLEDRHREHDLDHYGFDLSHAHDPKDPRVIKEV